MLCFASRPPDPEIVGDRWRDLWKHRLQTQPFPLEMWLGHQRRDDYWKHGSVCEDYRALQIPCLVISGWADGYINAPPAMAGSAQGFTRAINGPWIHKYPHFAWPRPRMDFHHEAIRWWERWLKRQVNDVEHLPAYRVFVSEDVKPGGNRQWESGHWEGVTEWPSGSVKPGSYYLSEQATLTREPGSAFQVSISSPEDCGTACGEFFPLKPDSELATDQRFDNAGSLLFESEPLGHSVSVIGNPTIQLQIAVDRPLANVAVRLLDVRADGSSHRVSWGALNLTHRFDQERPCPMQPGQTESVTITLNQCGYRFLPGHKIGLAISTAYWPMVMPLPEKVTAIITLGEGTHLTLPIYNGDNPLDISEPDNLSPLPEYDCLLAPDHRRAIERDIQNNVTHYRVYDDTGDFKIPGHGMCIRHTHEECWSISPDDPLTSTASSIYTCYMHRGAWHIRTVAESSLHCDAENFYLKASVTAWEGDQIFNQRNWEKVIERDYM